MPYAQAEGARLHYEETGHGHPIVFVHEYGSDHREWEQQVRFFSREYRCITFDARGYTPSEVPSDPRLYGQDFAAADIAAVMRHLDIPKAHIVGLSMGAFATLLFGIRYPHMASALVVAGVGTGSNLAEREAFRAAQVVRADALRSHGWHDLALESGHSPTRVQLKKKDPRGWAEFKQQFADGSATGHAMTMRGVQGARVPFFDRTDEIARISEPMLVVIGDGVVCDLCRQEREACFQHRYIDELSGAGMRPLIQGGRYREGCRRPR